MTRRWFVAVAVLVAAAFTTGVVVGAPEPPLGGVTVLPGEGSSSTARRLCPHAPGAAEAALRRRNPWLNLPGIVVHPDTTYWWSPIDCPSPATTTSTSTTLAPTTTTRPPTTTTTVAPTTTRPPNTTTTTSTTTASTTSTRPPAAGEWVQSFDSNTGGDTLRQGVYHRNVGQQELGGPVVTNPGVDNNAWHGGSWTADHDLACGSPSTQRPLQSERFPGPNNRPTFDFHVAELQYACANHWMTSIGDVDGYSIVWFSPDQQFSRADTRTISWDVSVTDLGGRMWWEVSIVPVGAPFLATVDWMAAVAHIDTYDNASVIVGSGPAARDPRITTNGQQRYTGGRNLCALDPVGCASKVIRRPFSITDNGNGTLTVNYAGVYTQTVPGQLPDRFEVYFKQHAYTPDKDGPIAGHTWHWDNISIR